MRDRFNAVMPETTTSSAVLANIVDTITALSVDGKPRFQSVGIFEDVATFDSVADASKGTAIGVVAKTPERADPMDNSHDYCEKLEIEIVFKYSAVRKPGAAESAAVSEMQQLADVIRNALLVDQFRDGNASAVMFGGRLIPGTDVTGSPRVLNNKANSGVYLASIPIVTAWTV